MAVSFNEFILTGIGSDLYSSDFNAFYNGEVYHNQENGTMVKFANNHKYVNIQFLHPLATEMINYTPAEKHVIPEIEGGNFNYVCMRVFQIHAGIVYEVVFKVSNPEKFPQKCKFIWNGVELFNFTRLSWVSGKKYYKPSDLVRLSDYCNKMQLTKEDDLEKAICIHTHKAGALKWWTISQTVMHKPKVKRLSKTLETDGLEGFTKFIRQF